MNAPSRPLPIDPAVQRSALVRALLLGVRVDQQAYGALRQALHEQFQAALRLDTARLGALAAEIDARVAELDQHRLRRLQLVLQLGLPQPTSTEALLALFESRHREAVAAQWQLLEALVAECKGLNSRNCRLLVDQHAAMRRVLDGEVHVYVPA